MLTEDCSWETFYARTLSHLSTKHKQEVPETENDNDNATSHQDPTPADEGSDSEEDADDDSDPGTSWFSEHDAPDKVLRFLTSDEFPLSPYSTSSTSKENGSPKILDLGTGNGSMLALLRRKGGFRGQDMVGVDYSLGSVRLARELQRLRIHSAYLGGSSDSEDEDEGQEQEQPEGPGTDDSDIRFEEWDILSSTDPLSDSSTGTLDWFPYAQGGFDIVLDKGTFDAVSLCEEVDADAQRRVCERYPAVARRLVRRGGFLVVTSCNWTEEEVVKWFTSSGDAPGEDELKVWGRVDYPRFQFGGKEGQGVCTVCFQRAS